MKRVRDPPSFVVDTSITKRSYEEQVLSFCSSPATSAATWTSGIMDIVVAYHGEPFAFMLVNDGVFEHRTVYRDARSKHHETLGYRGETMLMEAYRDRIVAGCRALIAMECPSALCKQGCPPVNRRGNVGVM